MPYKSRPHAEDTSRSSNVTPRNTNRHAKAFSGESGRGSVWWHAPPPQKNFFFKFGNGGIAYILRSSRRPWSCIFRNWFRKKCISKNVYLSETRIYLTFKKKSICWQRVSPQRSLNFPQKIYRAASQANNACEFNIHSTEGVNRCLNVGVGGWGSEGVTRAHLGGSRGMPPGNILKFKTCETPSFCRFLCTFLNGIFNNIHRLKTLKFHLIFTIDFTYIFNSSGG